MEKFRPEYFFQWSYGNDILNANRMVFENPASKQNTNMYATYINRWTPDNPTSNMPPVSYTHLTLPTILRV